MSEYPLALSSWDNKEIEAIHSVIESDNYSMGEKVKQFEKDFAKYLDVPYCVMVNSGSSANLLGIAALFYTKKNPLKRGDEVIVPAVSWSTTYYPLYQYGLKIKFVDVDLNTLNYDLEQLKSAVTDKTRLVVAVNLLGNPNDFGEIRKILEDDILLFEDNCESLGAKFEGKMAGTFGDIGTYSTFFSHHISTMEGGVISVRDEELYHILLSIRSHGWTRHLPKKNKITGTKSDSRFEESWKFVLPGYNMRPVEMSGAIGIEQLKKLPSFVEQRRENAKYFVERFKNNKYFFIQKEISESSWFGFSIIIRPDACFKRHELVQTLERENIDCRPIVAGNFVKNPVVNYMDYEVHGELKNADYLTDRGIMFGNHHVNCKAYIEYLYETIMRFCEGYRA